MTLKKLSTAFWVKLRQSILCAALGLAALPLQASEELLQAPDFTLRDLQGKQIVLSEHRGTIIFVDFWASWCPPCRKSVPAVEKLFERFQDRRFVIYGINMDNDQATARNFVTAKGIRYPVLVGDRKTAKAYRVSGIPAFFIINHEGKIVKRYAGYQPGMEAEWGVTIESLLNAAGSRPVKIK